MSETIITNADVEALAEKLEGMRDSFSDAEFAALHAVFHLAGAGVAEVADVEGFAVDMFKPANFEFSWGMHPTDQLSLNFTPISSFPTGGNAIKIKLLGGTDHK